MEGRSVITFFLPWPDRRLSPNAREHWFKKAKITKKARESAWATALEAKVSRISADRLSVRVTFCAPNKRRRDLDNCIGAFKAAGDGIAQAVGIDDSKWSVSYQWGDVVPGGAVKVELAPA